MWRDLHGRSFSLDANGNGFVFHVHSPMSSENYHGHKYNSLEAEILSVLGILGFATECEGDSETFGYYEFFEDFNAIVGYDSQGFVNATIYSDVYQARDEWNDLSGEYSDFLDREEEELEYERRDIDAPYYDDFESDLYDVYED